MRKRSVACAASTIASACERVRAKGFSTTTWKPASRAAIACCVCRELGEPTWMTSIGAFEPGPWAVSISSSEA